MRILIVQQDSRIADGLERPLRGLGYNVDRVLNCAAAGCALARAEYELVVVDLDSLLLDGGKVLRRLRRENPKVPALVISALESIEDREARIRALLARPEQTAGMRIVLGRLLFDRGELQAMVDDAPIKLSRGELALLGILATHAGRVVSKGRLTGAVTDKQLSLNAVETHVSRLRRKLKDSGAAIRTVRGLGYVLEHPDSRS